MVVVEFHFKTEDPHRDETERVEMREFSFEAVEEAINTHWDHVMVHKWRIVDDNLMEGEDSPIRIDIIGEYLGKDEREYFEQPFSETFKSYLLGIDTDCDVDKELSAVNENTSEVYVFSNENKKYCVLDTNDIILGDESLLASRRGLNKLVEKFGEFHPVNGDAPRTERIEDPVKVATLIKKLHSLQVTGGNVDVNDKLVDLEWELKMALFKDYQDEMIDAFIEPKPQPAAERVSIRQGIVNRYQRFHGMLFQRGLLKQVGKGIWRTLANAVLIGMLIFPLDMDPLWMLLAVFNRETIDAQKMFANELGSSKLIWLVGLLNDAYEGVVTLHEMVIKGLVMISIGNRGEIQNLDFTSTVIFSLIRIAQSTIIFIGTLYPPFSTEYRDQMSRIGL